MLNKLRVQFVLGATLAVLIALMMVTLPSRHQAIHR